MTVEPTAELEIRDVNRDQVNTTHNISYLSPRDNTNRRNVKIKREYFRISISQYFL